MRLVAVLLAAVVWEGCASSDSSSARSSTVQRDYAEFKQSVQTYLVGLGWGRQPAVDWRPFESALAFVRTPPARALLDENGLSLEQAFLDTIGVAEVELRQKTGKLKHKSDPRELYPDTVARLLAAARLIDFAKSAAQSAHLLRQAHALLNYALERHRNPPSHIKKAMKSSFIHESMVQLCRHYARLTEGEDKGCSYRAFTLVLARMIADVSIRETPQVTVNRNLKLKGFPNEVLRMLPNASPQQLRELPAVIDLFWAFHELFLQPVEKSLEDRNQRALEALHTATQRMDGFSTRASLDSD